MLLLSKTKVWYLIGPQSYKTILNLNMAGSPKMTLQHSLQHGFRSSESKLKFFAVVSILGLSFESEVANTQVVIDIR